MKTNHPEPHHHHTMERILEELSSATQKLQGIPPAIAVFGSARLSQDSFYAKQAQSLTKNLAEQGFAIFSGGGPGIMEAANRGCRQGNQTSIGLNIFLPNEQSPNPYQDISVDFDFFFLRKHIFTHYAMAHVAFPGGYGTLDEISEILVLLQNNKKTPSPFFLVGVDFWQPLYEWLSNTLLHQNMISAKDLDFLQLTDDIDQVAQKIHDFHHATYRSI